MDVQQHETPRVIYSTHQYNNLFAISTEEVLKELPYSDQEKKILKSIFRPNDGRRMLCCLYLCAITGAPAVHAINVLEDTLYSHIGSSLFENANTALKMKMDVLSVSALDGSFTGTIRELPAYFTAKRPKINLNSGVLALQVEPKEFERIVESCKPGPEPTVPYSIGFIRFDLTNKGFIKILEFRSELLERVQDRSILNQYQNWDAALLAALELVVARCRVVWETVALKDVTERKIVFPTPESIKKRFENVKTICSPYTIETKKGHYRLPPLSEEQAKHLYYTLPLQFGYEPAEVYNKEKGEDNSQFIFGLEKTINRANTTIDSIYRGFEFLSHQDEYNKLDILRKKISQLTNCIIPHDIELDGYSLAHAAFPHSEFAGEKILVSSMSWAPSLEIKPQRTESFPLHYSPLYEELLVQIKECGMQLPNDFTPISHGLLGDAKTQWWNMPEEGQLSHLHLPNQNRNPSLRFVYKGKFQHFSFKGAGISTIENVKVHVPPTSKVSRLPIYRRIHASKTDVFCNTHLYWGGMSRNFATNEFNNHLALHALIQITDPNLSDLINIPVKISKYLSLPYWDESAKKQWINSDEYISNFLGGINDLEDSLSVFESYGRCDVRLSELIAKLFEISDSSRLNPDLARKEIIEGIRFLYQLHGHIFKDPGHTLKTSNKKVSNKCILDFLTICGEHNLQSAQSIFDMISLKTGRLLGIIHGTGGHVGGGMNKWTGTPKGGSIAVRNIDLYGGFHDFDASVYFPWHPRFQSSKIYIDIAHHEQMACFDLMYWRESMNWFQAALFGNKNFMSGYIRRSHFAKNHFISFFGGDLDLSYLEEGFSKRSRKEIIGDQFNNPYYDAVALGTTFKGMII